VRPAPVTPASIWRRSRRFDGWRRWSARSRAAEEAPRFGGHVATGGRVVGAVRPGAEQYLTPYGPLGAALAPTGDPPDVGEPPLAGHPTRWLRRPAPRSRTTLQVDLKVPQLLLPRSDGTWLYRLNHLN
jgi:hypothetical protein